ncbi:copper chaperone PCu(A)C [Sphingomonas sp. Y38-1Y]|uniref:copper chaperone PCu(A)C n=1 Tax=Sphingomonas sp. Y38-1Y TaxID=3078265 RepID=UPI0028E98FE5|nr:copper chaperone PCu(A)C [Sphingomonas sp. Y38-1Y]
MRLSFLAVAGAALLAGCGGGADAPTATGAWIRLPAVPGRPAAAYVAIRGGDQDVRLTSLRIPAARLVELHRTSSAGGVMSMAPVDAIDVPAGATVALSPGGDHAMLFDLDPALKAGGTTRVTLMFDKAPPIELDAKLAAPGTAGPP